MRIAIDMRALDGASKYRGIGTYISFISRQLIPLLHEKHEITLYVYDRDNLDMIDTSVIDVCEVVVADKSPIKKLPGFLPQLFGGILPREFNRTEKALPEIESADVFFQPYHEMGIPAANVRSVVVCHDLIPLIFEQEYFQPVSFGSLRGFLGGIRRKLQKRTYKKGLRVFEEASEVIAVSNHTKRTLVDYLNIEENKIKVIYHGPPERHAASESKELLEKLPENYITYIGGIDYRRQIIPLIENLSSQNSLKLVVAGRDFETINSSPVRPVVNRAVSSGTVINLGYITEEEKRTIIERAVAFVYPTNYEGFGIPVLESFAYGAPIITYSNSSIPEVGGEAAIYVNDSAEMIAEARKLYEDTEYRNSHVKAGNEQMKKFSWKKSAEQTAELLVGNEHAS